MQTVKGVSSGGTSCPQVLEGGPQHAEHGQDLAEGDSPVTGQDTEYSPAASYCEPAGELGEDSGQRARTHRAQKAGERREPGKDHD